MNVWFMSAIVRRSLMLVTLMGKGLIVVEEISSAARAQS